MIEVSMAPARRISDSAMIMPDIPDFVSPVDGSVVHGRKSLAEHNRRNNVTNAADFTNEWKHKAKERASFYTEGKHDSHERKTQIYQAMKQLERRR
jgi:hypothetical protein